MKKAFTVIELIFVIVVLGILAAIAVPKFTSTKNMADISKGHADVATIRSAIVSERQTQLIKGNPNFIPKLSDNGNILFTGDGTRTLLMYGIKAASSGSPGWAASDAGYKTYTYTADDTAVTFTYNDTSGIFTCDVTDTDFGDTCKKLIY